MYLRQPDGGRFFTGYKKLTTSVHSRWELEKKRWVHLPWHVGHESGVSHQVRSYSCLKDILCKKIMCLCYLSLGKVMSEGEIRELEKNRKVHSLRHGPMTARRREIFDLRQKVADVWPWSVRVGQEKVSPLTMICTYDGQTSSDFWPQTNNCRRLAVVGQKGRLGSWRRIGESTN